MSTVVIVLITLSGYEALKLLVLKKLHDKKIIQPLLTEFLGVDGRIKECESRANLAYCCLDALDRKIVFANQKLDQAISNREEILKTLKDLASGTGDRMDNIADSMMELSEAVQGKADAKTVRMLNQRFSGHLKSHAKIRGKKNA
jgi:hypothetical protein